MILLKIIYAREMTAAIMVGVELYYIKIGPDFPELFDRNLKKLIIPNIDYWLQAQTQQRYTFRGVCDMIAAFIDGIQHSYRKNDLSLICDAIFDKTIAYVFKTNHTREFARSYWIEVLDEQRVKKLVTKIKDGFDEFQAKYEPEQFYDYLCRLWQFYNFYLPGEVATIERLIARLDRTPSEPQYPIVDAEQKIKKYIITQDLANTLNKFKGLDQEIKQNVDRIQTGRLSGTK